MTTANLSGITAWLLTYAVHSTLLLGAAWLLTRRLFQSHHQRDVIWKVALVGGLLSASVQVSLDRDPVTGRIAIGGSGVQTVTDGQTVGRSDGQRGAGIQTARPSGLRSERQPGAEIPTVRPSERPSAVSRLRATPFSLVAFWLWAAVAAALLLQLVVRQVRLALRLRPRAPVMESSVLALVDELSRAAGLSRTIRVTQTPSLSSPVALGRAEICLPEAALSQLDTEQQRSMLAHEVAHVARRDPLWLLACGVIECLFFFQPFNRLARRRLQETAEFLCDDWAVRRTGSGMTLAQCLVKVAEWIDTTPYPVPVAGMAEARSHFVSRIHRLVANRGLVVEPRRRWLLPLAVGFVAVLVAAAPGAKGGRSAAAPADPPSVDLPVESIAEPQLRSEEVKKIEKAVMTTNVTDTNIGTTEEPEPPSPPVRQARDTSVVAALLVALKDPEVDVRRAAAHALGNRRDPRAVPGLISAMSDQDAEVRRYATEALGNLRDDRAVEGLLGALKDQDPEVRASAAEALG
ncbi:MAG: HEAT repeat domain-containing protein, partial [Gemmatimonadetes bacterium]|nr:HEAT repeat domain-containing protein [Gemmatimonadota bacterium]